MKFPANYDSASPWVWLSHVLSEDTPIYAGGSSLVIKKVKSITNGDSCNTSNLVFSSHVGSHVDSPLHFVFGGRSVDDYQPEDWLFGRPLLVDLPLKGPELVNLERLNEALPTNIQYTDLLLIRTGFGLFRSEEKYWRCSPGFSSELVPFLLRRFPNLRAIGLDCISISSMQWREEGRRAHRALLGNGIRIFEDLALENVCSGSVLTYVIALPLRYSSGDGAPCTIIGRLNPQQNDESLCNK